MYMLPSLISFRERRPSEVRVGTHMTVREKWLSLEGWRMKRGEKDDSNGKNIRLSVTDYVVVPSLLDNAFSLTMKLLEVSFP